MRGGPPVYSNDDLNSAVAAGALSAEAADALRAHIAVQRQAPLQDEENFRLVTSFNDIFVTIGVIILLIAVGSIVAAAMPNETGASLLNTALSVGMPAAAIAATAWGLAEIFTRRRRMALPSIVLLLAFAGAAYLAVGSVVALPVFAIAGENLTAGNQALSGQQSAGPGTAALLLAATLTALLAQRRPRPSAGKLADSPATPRSGSGSRRPSRDLIGDCLDQPPFERGKHAGKVMPALEHLPMFAEQGPHPLPAPQRWPLLDPCLGPFGGAPEGGKYRRFAGKIHRVIAPLSGGHHATVQVENALQFSPLETNLKALPARREGHDGVARRAPHQSPARLRLAGLPPPCCAARSSATSPRKAFNSASSFSRLSRLGSQGSSHGVP